MIRCGVPFCSAAKVAQVHTRALLEATCSRMCDRQRIVVAPAVSPADGMGQTASRSTNCRDPCRRHAIGPANPGCQPSHWLSQGPSIRHHGSGSSVQTHWGHFVPASRSSEPDALIASELSRAAAHRRPGRQVWLARGRAFRLCCCWQRCAPSRCCGLSGVRRQVMLPCSSPASFLTATKSTAERSEAAGTFGSGSHAHRCCC